MNDLCDDQLVIALTIGDEEGAKKKNTTPIMLIAVVKLVPPRQASWLRSSGTSGADAFLESVDAGYIPVAVQLPMNDDGEGSMPVTSHMKAALFTAPVGNTPTAATSLDGGSEDRLAYVERMSVSVRALRKANRAVSTRLGNVFNVAHLECLRCDDLTAASRVTRAICPQTVGLTADHEEEVAVGGVPPDFLAFSTVSIVYLDTALSNVTTVGNGFLTSCRNLIELELAALSHVTSIGSGFLEGCVCIPSIDLTPLRKVSKVGDGFMSGCSSLERVDITPMGTLDTIGAKFFANCIALVDTVDISTLSNITHIGHSFLDGCTSLCLILLPDSFPNLSRVETRFMGSCSKLASVRPRGNTQPKEAESGSSGGRVDLSPFSASLHHIGTGFFAGCSSFGTTPIDLSPLVNLKTIPEDLLLREDVVVICPAHLVNIDICTSS